MKHNLNIWAPIAQTGYGIAALNFIKNLSTFDVEPLLKPMGNSCQINSAEEKVIIQRAIDEGKYPDNNAPCLKIWHQWLLGERIGRGPYYAMPIFELDRFNDIERHHLRIPDELMVNSHWAKDVIKREVGRDAHVVPLGVNTDIFKSQDNMNGQQTYQFLNIGKWEVRKGHDILPDLFNKAFTAKDDVALNLMPFNPFISQEQHLEWVKKYKNTKLGDKVFILNPVTNHQDIADVIQQCDCGIYPTRAEGWCFPLLETMACNKPVITTNYSGHTEFCDRTNSFLTDITEFEDAYDNKWFNGQGKWAKLTRSNEDEIIDYMRYCYKERPENHNGRLTAEKFTWKAATYKLVTTIFP